MTTTRPAIDRPATASGFSLIEVIISIAILSVGLIGAIRVFPVGLRASQRSALISKGTLVVQRTIEGLKLKPWDELDQSASVEHDDPFDVRVSVDQPEVEGLVDPTRLKRVQVTVSWEQEGRTRALTAVTYLSRSGS